MNGIDQREYRCVVRSFRAGGAQLQRQSWIDVADWDRTRVKRLVDTGFLSQEFSDRHPNTED